MKSIMKWLATLAIAMQIAFGSYAAAAAERHQPFQVGRAGEGAKRGWFSKLWAAAMLLSAVIILWVALGFHLIGFGTNY